MEQIHVCMLHHISKISCNTRGKHNNTDSNVY